MAAKLECPENLECISLRTEDAIFLITFTKDYRELIDYSLIFAVESYPNDGRLKSIREKIADAINGRSGTHINTWPVDFEKAGIFCSQITGRENSEFSAQTYKRRISPEGRIENKKIDSWYDCKAPW